MQRHGVNWKRKQPHDGNKKNSQQENDERKMPPQGKRQRRKQQQDFEERRKRMRGVCHNLAPQKDSDGKKERQNDEKIRRLGANLKRRQPPNADSRRMVAMISNLSGIVTKLPPRLRDAS